MIWVLFWLLGINPDHNRSRAEPLLVASWGAPGGVALLSLYKDTLYQGGYSKVAQIKMGRAPIFAPFSRDFFYTLSMVCWKTPGTKSPQFSLKTKYEI